MAPWRSRTEDQFPGGILQSQYVGASRRDRTFRAHLSPSEAWPCELPHPVGSGMVEDRPTRSHAAASDRRRYVARGGGLGFDRSRTRGAGDKTQRMTPGKVARRASRNGDM